MAALTYRANWQAIDYQHMPLLAHTWSLSLEEQFYLTWPLLLVLLLSRPSLRRRGVAAVLVLLALASAAWAAVLYLRGARLSRVVDLPDTHANGLLLGCALAVALAGAPSLGPRLRHALAAGAWWAVIAVSSLVLFVHAAGASALGGCLLASAGTAAVIAALSAGLLRPIGALLSHPVLVRIGIWSYAIYLVHLPVFQLLEQSDLSQRVRALAGTVLSLALAAALHRLVERPFLAMKDRLSSIAQSRGPGRLPGSAAPTPVAVAIEPSAGEPAPST